jgi:hypothetical protein
MVAAGAGLMLLVLPFEVELPDLDRAVAEDSATVRCQTPLASILRARPADGQGGRFAYAPATGVAVGTPSYCIGKGQDRAAVGATALVLGLGGAVVVSRRSTD